MGNKKLGFSITGSLMLIAFFALINFITSPGALWFIYPVYGALWWPLSVYCAQRKRYLLLSILGSAITAALLLVINITVAPGYPWSIYPLFVLLWWPLGVYSARKGKLVRFSIIGSILTIAFAVITNLVTLPGYPWSFYLIICVLWWPLSIYCSAEKRYKLLSVLGTLLLIGTLVFTNYFYDHSTDHPWFLYAAFPLLWWPLTMMLGKRAASVGFALISSAVIIGYYGALNYFLSPGYPWFIFPTFAILWWPIALLFGDKEKGFALSITGLLLSIAFFITVNLISSPNTIWAVYPIFALLWWPLSVYYFGARHRQKVVKQ